MSAGDVFGPIAGAIAGALAVGLAGRWLSVPGSARRVNHAKAEAELLSLLPDGLAQTALAEKVERDVLHHLDLDANRSYRRLMTIALTLIVVQLVGGTFIVAGLVDMVRFGAESTWAGSVLPIAIAVTLASQVPEFFILRKMRSIRTKSEERVDATVVAAAAHGHLDLSGSGGSTQQPAARGHIDLSGRAGEPPAAGGTGHMDLSGNG